jgi:hypothetical protein
MSQPTPPPEAPPSGNGAPLSLHDRIYLTADMVGVPRDVALRLFYSESGLNPNAPAGDNGRSFGIGQVQEPTAARYRLNPHILEQNILAALKYLREGYNRYGTWGMAYAAYRSGLEGPRRAGNQRPPAVEQESMDFVAGVPGTQWHGFVVGQGPIPSGGASLGLGNPGGLPDTGDPFGGHLPQGVVPNLPDLSNIGKHVADGLNEAGIRTTNQLANFWNAQAPTALFWGIAATSLILAFLFLKGGTVVKIVQLGASNIGATPGNAPSETKAAARAVLPSSGIKPITAATNIRRG